MSESGDFDDDDFGDFEEGEVNQMETSNESRSQSIDSLISEILPKVDTGNGDELSRSEFKFDERSEKLFDTLLNTEEYPIQQMIWKHSMILKQLFLNLDIPIVENSFLTRQSLKNKDLKYDLKLYEDFKLDVPDFDKLGISDEEFKLILSNTNDQISQIDIINKDYKDLDSEQMNEEILKLAHVKQSLLKTLSAWNKQYDIIKSDNELFTNYIDNLVGNTQKFRRRNKPS